MLVPKHEAQHRAYLQRLQERNQTFRQQKGNDDKFLDKLRREQGFSVCFSGANASKGGVPSRNKPSKGHSRGGSPWRQWEEGTVEIKGLRGEVYAVRPTGERVATKAPGLNFCKDALPSWAATQKVDEGVLQASEESQLNLDATGQDLVFLRQQLSKDAGLDDETGIPDDKVEDLSHEVPIPSDLTERVARLPNHWRHALMDLLEEAEALQEKMTCDTCDEDLLHTPVDEGNEALTEDVLGIDEPDEIGEICEVDRKLDPDSEKEDEQLEADSEPIRSTSSGGNPAPSKSQCSVPSQEPVGCSQGSQGSQDRQAEVSAETPDGEDVTATSRARESPATVGKDLVAAGGGAAAVRVVRAAEKDLPD